MSAGSREVVLLLHGLWMNRLVMQYLGAALERAGYVAVAFGYRSMFGELDEHLDRLADRLAGLNASRVHLVGHSLGGVIALHYLGRTNVDARIGRTVLLGAPVADCQAARDFGQLAGGELFLGGSASVWRSAMPLQIPPGRAVGAISGSNVMGIASLFVDLEGANDGVVRVEETRLPGMSDHRVLPVSHTGMLFSADVARECVSFLHDGRFSR